MSREGRGLHGKSDATSPKDVVPKDCQHQGLPRARTPSFNRGVQSAGVITFPGGKLPKQLDGGLGIVPSDVCHAARLRSRLRNWH